MSTKACCLESVAINSPRKIVGMNSRNATIDPRLIMPPASASSSSSSASGVQQQNMINSSHMLPGRWTSFNNTVPQENRLMWPYNGHQYMTTSGIVHQLPAKLSPAVPMPVPIYYTQTNGLVAQYDNNGNPIHFMPNSSAASIRSNEPQQHAPAPQPSSNNITININSPNEIQMPTVTSLQQSQNSKSDITSILKKPNATMMNNVPFNSQQNYHNFENKIPATKEIADNLMDIIDGKMLNDEHSFNVPVDYMTPANSPVFAMANLNKQQFLELTQMAMHGCELAERLAVTHRNRPCFKKIDSLCARMKQDLVRPDSVLANINSQGIAWAVKDFIFVFTRIINAWIIIKGYVYNTPAGMTSVKSAITENFNESFLKWQESTKDFVDNLIKSFTNLDQMVQSQRAGYQKSDGLDNVQYTTTSKDHLDSNYEMSEGSTPSPQQQLFDESIEYYQNYSNMFPTDTNKNSTPVKSVNINVGPEMEQCKNSGRGGTNVQINNLISINKFIEDQESQRKADKNGTYINTGVYVPLVSNDDFSHMIQIPAVSSNEPKPIFTKKSSTPSNWMNLFDFNEVGQIENFNNFEKKLQSVMHADDINNNNLPLTASVEQRKFQDLHVNPIKTINIDSMKSADKTTYLISKIMNLSGTEYFFSTKFTKNYFEDFQTIIPNYTDLRTIILKGQTGGYKHIFEIVHDLRSIIFNINTYLQIKPNDCLFKSIVTFERELENILSENLFVYYDFKHISGCPNEF